MANNKIKKGINNNNKVKKTKKKQKIQRVKNKMTQMQNNAERQRAHRIRTTIKLNTTRYATATGFANGSQIQVQTRRTRFIEQFSNTRGTYSLKRPPTITHHFFTGNIDQVENTIQHLMQHNQLIICFYFV
jgi:hypothetical protein